MNTLIFIPKHNSHGKRDVTGAFRPEAKRFQQIHGGTIVEFDNHLSMKKRRKVVLDAIGGEGEFEHEEGMLDCIAFFCHGWRSGIQAGFRIADVNELALTIHNNCADIINVPLYACSTAKGGAGGDGAFADELRDALCRHGAIYSRVDAHDRKGHATRNPYVRRFDGCGSPVGGIGGQWIVKPDSQLWPKWRKALKTDFRFNFPFLGASQIHERLA